MNGDAIFSKFCFALGKEAANTINVANDENTKIENERDRCVLND